jgi:hypothetical protein
VDFFPRLRVRILSLPLHLSMKAAESHTNEARLGYYIRTASTQLKPTHHTQTRNISDIVFRPVPFEEMLQIEDRIFFPPRTSIWLPAFHGELSSSCKCSVQIWMSFTVIRTGSSLAIMSAVYWVCCSVQLPAICDVKNVWHNIKSYRRWRKI